MDKLTLKTTNTWCPGCSNFFVFEALKKAISNKKKENIVLVTGIGCHAKIADYININSFYGLHGRAIPVAQGIKAGNSNLSVICSSGDGDSFNEGISHIIHAAKRNNDITVIIHDNHNFALTVKQFTATSPKGFKGSSTPFGSIEDPINPAELMIAAGATFVARGYAPKVDHLANIIDKAIEHNGFSFVQVLQPCITWFNTYADYNKRVFEYSGPTSDKRKALDIVTKEDLPIGIFYEENKPSFEDLLLNKNVK